MALGFRNRGHYAGAAPSGEQGGEIDGEDFRTPSAAEDFADEETAHAGESGVVEGETRAFIGATEGPDEFGIQAAACPRIDEALGRDELEYFAVNDAVEAGPGLGSKLESVADAGFEIVRHEPFGDRVGVRERLPDMLGRLGIGHFEMEVVAHGRRGPRGVESRSRYLPRAFIFVVQKDL